MQEISYKCNKIFKASEKLIITSEGKVLQVYSYENSTLISKDKAVVIDNIYGIRAVSNDEIAIYYYKEGKIYGWNAFLLFFDIYYYQDNKTLKLGDGEKGGCIEIFDKNTLLLDRNQKIILIDTRNKIVKNEFKIDLYIDSIIKLNEQMLLVRNNRRIIQYEIHCFDLREICQKYIDVNFFWKYPENKLIISNDKEIIIYKSEKIQYGYLCDGCYEKPIIGKRFRCNECKNFDYCERCYEKKKESHGHTFTEY